MYINIYIADRCFKSVILLVNFFLKFIKLDDKHIDGFNIKEF